jgi:glycosyltransferase involved in cell wall biosynthesis
MKFSVLMSIYKSENSKHFDRAMQSIWDEQKVKPSEIVLVQDGPLPDVLHQEIDNWKKKLCDAFIVVDLAENVGVGAAKHIGIEVCSNELIAVMDTDDVSLPDRFEKQLVVLSTGNIDVCGAWVGEFEDDENEIVSHRRTPEQHEDIVAFAKSRSPVNHPTAMYKKSAVLSAGNYTKYRTSEDYNLFVKLIMDDAKFYNIQESLVNMRTGNCQLSMRRGGLSNAIFEAGVQKEFYNIGFLNFFELVKNVSIGFVLRILPNKLMKIAFKFIRKL